MKIRFIVKEQMENPQDVAQNLPSDEQEATQTRESLRTTMDRLDLNRLDTTQLKALQGFISGLQNNMSERKKEDPVSKKIKMLRDEGKLQKQAVAIALGMKRRGKLQEEEGDWFDRLIKWLTGTKAGNTVLDTANRRRGENQVSSVYKGKK